MVLPLKLRVWALAGVGLGLAAGCYPRMAWQRDESDRISEEMKPEPFTDRTPGAQGIALGEDAPPLAPPFQQYADDFLYPAWDQPWMWGGCCGYVGGAAHGLPPARFIYRGSGLP